MNKIEGNLNKLDCDFLKKENDLLVLKPDLLP